MRKEHGVDVVVVGSGGGGFRAAIAAAEKGCGVVLLSKGKATRSGASPMAGGGLMGDIDTDGPSLKAMGFPKVDDSYTQDVWFKDIVLAGAYINNQKMVRRHIEESAGVVRELIDWGASVFERGAANALSIRGTDMMDVLQKKALALGVSIVEDFFVTDVVSDGREASGCVGVDVHEGELVYWPARAVVIATGGVHGLYRHNSGSTCCTGDGLAMAHRAGADLMNMEMIEFCPDTVVLPEKMRGSIVTYVLSAYGGVDHRNAEGEAFIERYYQGKTLELALNSEWNKMLCSYAMYKEGADTGGIRLKVCPERLESAYQRRHYLKEKAGFFREMSTWDIVTMPAAHYMAGGIAIDEKCASGVAGLYACGEATAAVFGANRVSSALTEMLTLGKIAGEEAAVYALSAAPTEDAERAAALAAENLAPFARQTTPAPKDIFKAEHDLKETMHRNVNVAKSEKTLLAATADCSGLRERLDAFALEGGPGKYNVPWITWMNLRNMLPVAELMIASSLFRKESRGVFVREDKFFTDNANWLKCTVVTPDGKLTTADPDLSELRPDFDRLDYFDAVNHLAERAG